jgi:hypothetical protein
VIAREPFGKLDDCQLGSLEVNQVSNMGQSKRESQRKSGQKSSRTIGRGDFIGGSGSSGQSMVSSGGASGVLNSCERHRGIIVERCNEAQKWKSLTSQCKSGQQFSTTAGRSDSFSGEKLVTELVVVGNKQNKTKRKTKMERILGEITDVSESIRTVRNWSHLKSLRVTALKLSERVLSVSHLHAAQTVFTQWEALLVQWRERVDKAIRWRADCREKRSEQSWAMSSDCSVVEATMCRISDGSLVTPLECTTSGGDGADTSLGAMIPGESMACMVRASDLSEDTPSADSATREPDERAGCNLVSSVKEGSVFGQNSRVKEGSVFGQNSRVKEGSVFGQNSRVKEGSVFGQNSRVKEGSVFNLDSRVTGGSVTNLDSRATEGSVFNLDSRATEGSVFNLDSRATEGSVFNLDSRVTEGSAFDGVDRGTCSVTMGEDRAAIVCVVVGGAAVCFVISALQSLVAISVVGIDSKTASFVVSQRIGSLKGSTMNNTVAQGCRQRSAHHGGDLCDDHRMELSSVRGEVILHSVHAPCDDQLLGDRVLACCDGTSPGRLRRCQQSRECSSGPRLCRQSSALLLFIEWMQRGDERTGAPLHTESFLITAVEREEPLTDGQYYSHVVCRADANTHQGGDGLRVVNSGVLLYPRCSQPSCAHCSTSHSAAKAGCTESFACFDEHSSLVVMRRCVEILRQVSVRRQPHLVLTVGDVNPEQWCCSSPENGMHSGTAMSSEMMPQQLDSERWNSEGGISWQLSAEGESITALVVLSFQVLHQQALSRDEGYAHTWSHEEGVWLSMRVLTIWAARVAEGRQADSSERRQGAQHQPLALVVVGSSPWAVNTLLVDWSYDNDLPGENILTVIDVTRGGTTSAAITPAGDAPVCAVCCEVWSPEKSVMWSTAEGVAVSRRASQPSGTDKSTHSFEHWGRSSMRRVTVCRPQHRRWRYCTSCLVVGRRKTHVMILQFRCFDKDNPAEERGRRYEQHHGVDDHWSNSIYEVRGVIEDGSRRRETRRAKVESFLPCTYNVMCDIEICCLRLFTSCDVHLPERN